jgi:hexosaminidase
VSRVFDVRIDARVDENHGRAHVALSNQSNFGDIRYTLDGTGPNASSPRYQRALDVPLEDQLRAATFQGGRLVSGVAARQLDSVSLARRNSRELKLCSEGLAIALEDDAPIAGARAVFMIDIMNPCWIYEGADLSHGATLLAAVGQLPFNFQIGDDVHKIELRKPQSASGELEVRIDSCEGERIAVVPLETAAARDDVTILPSARIEPRPGRHDLCLNFTQNGVDPMWAIDWVALGK